MNKTNNVRVAGAYVTGKSHLARNIPCQDRTYSKTLNGTTVISLADGAGSKSKSDIGAEIVTQFIAEFLCSNFDKIYEKEEKSSSKTILDGIQKCLIQKANEIKLNPKDLKDLSSTILFVGVKNNKYFAGHIGDGLIGYFDDKEDAKILSYPYNEGVDDQYTVFTTNIDVLENFRIYKDNLNDIKGFVLMSDGTCDTLYEPKDKILLEDNKKIFNVLNDHRLSIKTIEERIKKTIKAKYLDKSINGDDCSINLLAITDSPHIASIDKVKVKVSKKPELKSDKVVDRTNMIYQLEKDIVSMKNKLKDINNRFDVKIKDNVSNKYKSMLDKSTSKTADNTKRIKRLKENVTAIKKELNDFQNKLVSKIDKISSGRESVPIEEVRSIIKWKKNVTILLIIISTGLVGILIKLLFYT